MRVLLFASHLVVYRKGVEVARHERLIAKGRGPGWIWTTTWKLWLTSPAAARGHRAGAGPGRGNLHRRP